MVGNIAVSLAASQESADEPMSCTTLKAKYPFWHLIESKIGTYSPKFVRELQ
ncbi:hypothetical protein M427DRAFT_53625 [Gonapodya prolifera JEL478]|uniref:Uncharacterized protein n=1 Tax=Gonapodya prolifera (strain JEL478) TaxID=1344416 RepID=A0A139APM6_GONPJ|nr:hypothetical protein M427DRAFT_53625 [Gonapodya prolifera JEL478]|eukprot:KXS18682.1 hypothetical protein M427DRAFT_53625 [Gonapodya prolifera JEL478]